VFSFEFNSFKDYDKNMSLLPQNYDNRDNLSSILTAGKNMYWIFDKESQEFNRLNGFDSYDIIAKFDPEIILFENGEKKHK
jgi:hypothetical protein